MLDEIQAGVGRTGKWFAYQHDDILPDVVSLAKALANGVPIGCSLARGKAAQMLVPGNHGTTFGGNPLACAAALATINTLEVHNYIEHVATKGEKLLNSFRTALEGTAGVKQVRGKGYMIGIQLDRECGELVAAALDKKMLINVTRGDTVRLLPTFVMTQEQSEHLVAELSQIIKDFLNK